MRRFVLDTTVLIECEQGIEPTSSRIQALLKAGDELCVCAIALAEYHTGSPRGVNPSMDAFLDGLSYVDLTPAMAATAGAVRHTALARGRRLPTPDALVAACARHLSATVLTNNAADFELTGAQVERLGGRYDASGV